MPSREIFADLIFRFFLVLPEHVQTAWYRLLVSTYSFGWHKAQEVVVIRESWYAEEVIEISWICLTAKSGRHWLGNCNKGIQLSPWQFRILKHNLIFINKKLSHNLLVSCQMNPMFNIFITINKLWPPHACIES